MTTRYPFSMLLFSSPHGGSRARPRLGLGQQARQKQPWHRRFCPIRRQDRHTEKRGHERSLSRRKQRGGCGVPPRPPSTHSFPEPASRLWPAACQRPGRAPTLPSPRPPLPCSPPSVPRRATRATRARRGEGKGRGAARPTRSRGKGGARLGAANVNTHPHVQNLRGPRLGSCLPSKPDRSWGEDDGKIKKGGMGRGVKGGRGIRPRRTTGRGGGEEAVGTEKGGGEGIQYPSAAVDWSGDSAAAGGGAGTSQAWEKKMRAEPS